ncbi:phage tail assembly protein, partial [Pseudoalteromonas sp. MMG024]|uniref:phage tail assembly protein n=1 Tax=Pseudoalteromonas sp. MMG024 TaxID=2909980 RepID=UPI001F2CE8CF
LREPVADKKELEFRPFTFAEYKEALAEAGSSEEKREDAFITLATGLTQAEIEQLKTPDKNTIDAHVIDYTTRDAAYFFLKDGVELDKDAPKLLHPIESYDRVTLKTPSVKASRMMNKVQNTANNPYAQAEYITQACTELMPHEIESLSLPDWNQLQGRISDFLNLGSDSFQ